MTKEGGLEGRLLGEEPVKIKQTVGEEEAPELLPLTGVTTKRIILEEGNERPPPGSAEDKRQFLTSEL